ncbi:MAG: hypothetical protein AAF821_00045 [Cyanobacteria bacterium P01_D01_bin.156]
MKTLADLAKEHNVSPQAVAKWRDKAVAEYGELPYQPDGKRKLYDANEVTKILEFKPAPDTLPVTETEILTGNHRVPGSLASMPTTVDLGAIRGDAELTLYNDDALAAVDQALELADQMLDAIEEDTEFQFQQLQKTQSANAKLQRKVDQLNQRKERYKADSRLLSLIQGKESTQLQENMKTLKGLGEQSQS